MAKLDSILEASASCHKHLCPRQVLGARMGLYAAELLDLELPRTDKRLLVIAETDGCTVDGLIAATGCSIGSRTLRILDFGKVAATLVDTYTEETIRITPSPQSRALAVAYAPNARHNWEAMLLGYQIMPARALFAIQYVQLDLSLAQILSKPGRRATCEVCGEEILNEREVLYEGVVLCRACAGESYYRFSESFEKSHHEIMLMR